MRRALAHAEEVLLGCLLAGMTLVTFIQVVLRYGFNTGFVWALEATTYMFGWMVMIGISYGVRVNAHIGVDALVAVLPPRARRAVGLLAVSLCAVYAALMLYGSWQFSERLFRLGTNARDIPVPRWLLTSIVPIGFALFGYRLLELAFDILRGRRDRMLLGHEDGKTGSDVPPGGAAARTSERDDPLIRS